MLLRDNAARRKTVFIAISSRSGTRPKAAAPWRPLTPAEDKRGVAAMVQSVRKRKKLQNQLI
jgi:hypothetical protein